MRKLDRVGDLGDGIKLSKVDANGEVAVLCPVCGFDYVHLERIEEQGCDLDLYFWGECWHNFRVCFHSCKGHISVNTERLEDGSRDHPETPARAVTSQPSCWADRLRESCDEHYRPEERRLDVDHLQKVWPPENPLFQATLDTIHDVMRAFPSHQMLDLFFRGVYDSRSPLEVAMLAALIIEAHDRFNSVRVNDGGSINVDDYGVSCCDVVTQKEIDKYRVDFEVTVGYLLKGGTHKHKSVLVEVDGKEYHDNSKEQIQRDRARDRAIQKATGLQIYRYSGSELWTDLIGCAKEVLDTVDFIRPADSVDVIKVDRSNAVRSPDYLTAALPF